MKSRFEIKKDPSVVRQSVYDMKQEFGECLENFVDRVQHAVTLGFKGTNPYINGPRISSSKGLERRGLL